MKSRCWIMKSRPDGEPSVDNFELQERELNELPQGSMRVKVNYLSLDPYMRGRMRNAESYMEPLKIGDVITGESVGEVIESNSKSFKVGDAVAVHGGWRDMIDISDASPMIRKIDLSLAPESTWLGCVGMPGRTAYFGLMEIGKPKADETIVISAASGAVGSVVGQIAKKQGLRVVGTAGSDEKCNYCEKELGFDVCVNYKKFPSVDAMLNQLERICLTGIDVYFENTAGHVSKAVAQLLNKNARVPICGYVSLYNSAGNEIDQEETPFGIFAKANHVPDHRFFLVTEFMDRWDEASKYLANMISEGSLKYRETVTEGFKNAPEAFIGMLNGKNFGKQLVKTS